MKFFKGKLYFVKNNITRDINTASRDIEALDSFVLHTIAKKNTLFGTEHEFAIVIGTKIGPTSTPKHTKWSIIWLGMKETFGGSFMLDDTARQNINKINSSEESFIPEFQRHGGSSKQS